LENNRLGFRVTARVEAPQPDADLLEADSVHFFAARVLRSIPVLLVDGDPSADPQRSETYFLSRLGLPGTGLVVHTISAAEMETIPLTRYAVIFLCNVDEFSNDRMKSLDQWVRQGGGLVLMPGDRVRNAVFNRTFYGDEGKGLSPIELLEIQGDPTFSKWTQLEPVERVHPALRVTADPDIDIGAAEVFSWWHSRLPADAGAQKIVRVMQLANVEHSPAMVEKPVGAGKVVAFCLPADGDWSMWPGHPTYICVTWDLVNYLVGNPGGSSAAQVGGEIGQVVDLARHDTRVTLVDPVGEKTDQDAAPLDEDQAGEQSVLYRVRFSGLGRRGFYTIELRQHGGATDDVLFGVNADPTESDLTRVDEGLIENNFFGPHVQVVRGDGAPEEAVSRASAEWWPQVLIVLGVLLAAEQLLAWWFGNRRWFGAPTT
jgi:hypothetical protein